MGQNQAKWNALANVVGEDDARLNKALACAMAAIQRRDGGLPAWTDQTAWEDLYGCAVATYKAA